MIKKGMNILALDVRGLSSLTDFCIIAEGSAAKHVSGIAHEIVKKLKSLGISPLHTEGMSEGDWAVLDYPQVMVHLFMPGLRDKYMLEQLWKESTIVDLSLNLSHPLHEAL